MVMETAIPVLMARSVVGIYNHDMTTRGARIRRARKAAKFSQEELADRMGVTQSLVSQWESGAKKISADQLQRLAETLDVTVVYLLYGTELTEHEGNGSVIDRIAGAAIPMVDIASAVQRLEPIPGAKRIKAAFACGPRSYWFELPDDSNAPDYPKGSRSVFDPDARPTPGSIVLALSGDEPIIGEIHYETTANGRVMIVRPINSRWPAARSDVDAVDIVAVMTENTRFVPR